ncbi:MAG: hypothetical protein U5K38_14415 [Woeseiaceae bacterium]|nr:hypothetical protein [Woeseiaceae bacterium]
MSKPAIDIDHLNAEEKLELIEYLESLEAIRRVFQLRMLKKKCSTGGSPSWSPATLKLYLGEEVRARIQKELS